MHDAHPHKVIGTKQNMNAHGDLASDIYRDTGIRTDVYDLFEDEVNKTGRVVVIEVPSRPIGKVFKFEDVPLMRVGEDLLPMDDKTFLKTGKDGVLGKTWQNQCHILYSSTSIL